MYFYLSLYYNIIKYTLFKKTLSISILKKNKTSKKKCMSIDIYNLLCI